MCVATHIDELDDEIGLKHAVLSVFFLRFLKFAGYFEAKGDCKILSLIPTGDPLNIQTDQMF